MRASDRRSKVGSPQRGLFQRQRPVIKNLLQRPSVHILHYEVRNAFRIRSHVIQPYDERVGQTSDDLRFTKELLLNVSGTKTMKECLQRNSAANQRVTSFVHAAGCPGSQRFKKFVTALRSNHKFFA